jgi:hypothetical protein
MIIIKQPTEKTYEKGDYIVVVTTFTSGIIQADSSEIKGIYSDDSFSIKDIEEAMNISQSFDDDVICITDITKI